MNLSLSLARNPKASLSSPSGSQAGASEINANFGSLGAAIDNSPITPETSSNWKIFVALLSLLISGALLYLLLLHR